jgi:hypothetical protein
MLDPDAGVQFQTGANIFLYFTASRAVLESTQSSFVLNTGRYGFNDKAAEA